MVFPSPTSLSSSSYPAPIHLRHQPLLPSIPPLLPSPRTLPLLLPTLRLARPLLPPLPVSSSGSGSVVDVADSDEKLTSGGGADDELLSGGGGDDELPSGGGDDGGSGGGGDEGDGGGEDGSGDGDDASAGNRGEALFVLAQLGRKLESLPADLAAAVESGHVTGDIVRRYVDLEASPLFRWLLHFGGFRERLLADDLFLTKIGIECGIGVFTKVCGKFPFRFVLFCFGSLFLFCGL
jgi:hypothetical protein